MHMGAELNFRSFRPLIHVSPWMYLDIFLVSRYIHIETCISGRREYVIFYYYHQQLAQLFCTVVYLLL
jgi:hypothetical protein